ncbi:7TM-DISM domain-containing protein [Lysobacter silvisoli]|uniref:Membrane protein n=1 Tax=Lysobacter silvisoli TaxID=2293254 RepID=A0A371JY96_9GAMM|nr:7TM-DISM domain-containing protein [Lysobacter silvisoli]RDZ26643.1 membrane protein [Lysobacter silvisoli]
MRVIGKFLRIAACLLWLVAFAASAQTLTIERVQGAARAQPGQLRSQPALQRWSGTADELRLALPRDPGGYWLRLSVDHDLAANQRRVITLTGSRVYGGAIYFAPGARRGLRVGDDAQEDARLLRRGWALKLPQGWPRAEPAYLYLQPRMSMTLTAQVLGATDLQRQLDGDRRFALVAYAMMLLMTLTAAAFWLASRDSVYLYYAAYLVSISLYLLQMTGWLLLPAERWGQVQLRDVGAWVAATLSTIFQLCFTVRFLQLPRLAPRAATALRALVWANAVWLAVLLLATRQVYQYWYVGGNGLLLLTIPVVIYAAIAAWRRGAEYAGYYLLGWTPLMVFAGLLAAKTLGVGSASWAERGLVLAVVLESGVLMLALTQRAAERHRQTQWAQPSSS